MDNILSLKNISKKFPGVIALNNVSFNVKKGQILSIVGENGAGKSTLLKIISGVISHNKFEGTIYFDGNEVNFSNIKNSEKSGIAIIHQELAYQPHLTLVENIFQGNYLSKMGITN
jgi:ABC-type sugar transport system ATPase subunit